MSNHKCYGNHPTNCGRKPSPYSGLSVVDVNTPIDDVYDRLLELAEGLMRKGYGEEYAMWKAAEMCERNEI